LNKASVFLLVLLTALDKHGFLRKYLLLGSFNALLDIFLRDFFKHAVEGIVVTVQFAEEFKLCVFVTLIKV